MFNTVGAASPAGVSNQLISKPIETLPLESAKKADKPSKVAKELDYHFFFSSKVFDAYLDQFNSFAINEIANSSYLKNLKNTADNVFAAKVLNFISLLQKSTLQPDEKRALHEKILTELRDLIKDKKTYQSDVNYITAEAIQIVDRICLWIYTKPDLMPSILDFLRTLDPNNFDVRTAENTSFVKLINDIQTAFEDHPAIVGSLHPKKSIHRDLHLEGYLPTYLYEAFSTQFIMTPRLTIENVAAKTAFVNPEFINYLRCLKAQGKTHLYVNLMDRTNLEEHKEGEEYRVFPERRLSAIIESLAQEEEFKGVLTVITLDERSSFYLQKSEYKTIDTAVEFKNTFLDRMFVKDDEKALFKWPEYMDKDQWRNQCQNIIQAIHTRYFADKDKLTTEERGEFIEIAYAKIIQTVCEDKKFDYGNISCKYTKDRGPSLLSFYYAYYLSEKNLPLTADDKLKLLGIFYGAPLLSRNHVPSNSKFDRFISSFLRINQANGAESPERAVFASYAVSRGWKKVKKSSKSATNGVGMFIRLMNKIKTIAKAVFAMFSSCYKSMSQLTFEKLRKLFRLSNNRIKINIA